MLSKRFTKKLIGILLSLSVFATVCVSTTNVKQAFAAPAAQDQSLQGDRQFTTNLSSTEIPAGANPGAVDFNGNGKYDQGETLPLKGTEKFTASKSIIPEAESFMDLNGIEGGIIRNNTIVVREDIAGYNQAYKRDIATSGYIYLKVSFKGKVGEALKPVIDKAVEEYKKNKTLLAEGKGSQISLLQQETLATVLMNSLGMVYDDGTGSVNNTFKLNVSYSTGAKSDVKKVDIADLVMDTTTAKQNQYTNPYNAPKIVDENGNIYLKVYGLPSGSEIKGISFTGELQFPSLVDKSIVKRISKQSTITDKTGLIPFIDPMLTESINQDNSNPLDPLAIKATTTYFVGVDVNEKGEVTNKVNDVIRHIDATSDTDKSFGYNHANVRPLTDSAVFYDALYDPENTIKRIQMKDSEGKLYTARILKEDKKVGQMQSYAKVDGLVTDPEKNSSIYKDFVVEGLKAGTDYKFTELIVTFNSGNGDVNRRFTNYDPISVKPLTVRTMGATSQAGDLLKTFELSSLTPTKAEFTADFNDPDKVIKSVSVVGDSIASSVYDTATKKLSVYGLTPGTEHKSLELVVTLVNGEQLGMPITPFTTEKIKNAKEWIEGFYHIFFLRDGDPSGMAYWTSKLSSQEISVNYFTSNIVNEKEYKEKNLDNTKYVERMYRSVTGRTSDAEGLAFWVATLEQTITETGDRTAAMQHISSRMLGETETRNFLYSIGLKVE